MTLTPSPPDPAAEPVFVPGIVRMTGHGTTVTADDLRTELVLASDCAGTTIDASAMDSVGQAVLQVLVAARNDALLHGQPFTFTATSDAFAERVNRCQLAESIGMDAGKDCAQ